METASRKWVTIATIASSLSAFVSMALLVAMRRGTLAYSPSLFAKVAAGVIGIAIVALVLAIKHRAVAAVLFSAGLLLVFAGGMANYLFSLQGFALLTELDHIQLAEGKSLQEFESGPLSDVDEMDLTLQLEKLELTLRDGGLRPSSRIRLIRKGAPARVLTVDPDTEGVDGTLRFLQGAYGFAPRIVVTRNGNAVFDRYVPFTTRRIAGRGIAFEETFEIASERLTVRGALNLDSLDEEMRGHARLGLAVTRDEKDLGRGELSMGHFAALSDGSYIGYAGLKRWSEIDIARRNYPEPMFAGAALIALSVVVWPFTRRRAA